MSIYIYPTDTVWGIGASIHKEDSAKIVNSIKGHTEVKPLSILFIDLDMLADYFQLELFDRDWLLELFRLEATLGLPVSWLRKEIPKDAYAGSDFICVRVLNSKAISKMFEVSGGPVYTTSFNLKGEEPLSSKDDALLLKNKIAPDACFFETEESLSGHSSTIIVYDLNNQFKVLRAGTRVEEIEKHLKLLTA